MTAYDPAMRFSLRYVNGDAREINFDRSDIFDVLGLEGDWAGAPFAVTLDTSPSGDEATPTGVKHELPRLIVPVAVGAPPGWNIRDVLDEIEDVMVPVLDDRTENRGHLIFGRRLGITQPDTWWMPCVPAGPTGFQLTQENAARAETYMTELAWIGLSTYWQSATETITTLVAVSAATWTTLAVSVEPGGNVFTYPTWEFDGPVTGTLDDITIENQSTGGVISLSGLGLVSGQTLTITTGFLQKDITVGGVSIYRTRAPSTEFFPLRAGSNSLVITKGATSQSAVRLKYRPRRTGVI